MPDFPYINDACVPANSWTKPAIRSPDRCAENVEEIIERSKVDSQGTAIPQPKPFQPSIATFTLAHAGQPNHWPNSYNFLIIFGEALAAF